MNDRLFNRGCDGRLLGLPLTACEYAFDTTEYREWRRGWFDVEFHWAADARWPVRPLPRVREARAVAS